MDDKVIKDVTKTNFRNVLILLFSFWFMILILMVLYIGIKGFVFSIPLVITSIIILIFICIHIKSYFKYKNNTNILVGTITNVNSYKSYQIVIKSDEKNYIASYILISSSIRNQVGRKCTFVVDGKGKAYIKDII